MLTIETELALQWRVFVFGFRALFRGCCKGIAAAGQAAGKKMNWAKARSQQELVDIVEDPADPSERVPAWQWGPGLLATIICISDKTGKLPATPRFGSKGLGKDLSDKLASFLVFSGGGQA